ncbi:hypothetical protein [Halarchaeum sp. CBA1220]|nr:hypothetical protein [Halarchaeum sp. CBA1220]
MVVLITGGVAVGFLPIVALPAVCIGIVEVVTSAAIAWLVTRN